MNKDEHNIPHSAQYTSATWAWAQLPYAADIMPNGALEVFNIVNRYMAFYRVLNPAMSSLKHNLLHRHTGINHFLKQTDCKQVIEVAAGFSPRGCQFSEDQQLSYFEVDLKEVMETKHSLLKHSESGRRVLGRHNFFLRVGDIEDLQLGQHFPAQKSFIISEGIMMYFDRPRQIKIWQHIAEHLAKEGGEYIFDLIPDDDHPKRSWLGKIFSAVKKKMNGEVSDIKTDERTRQDVINDLKYAGFTDVVAYDSEVVAKQWGLPKSVGKSKVILFHCKP